LALLALEFAVVLAPLVEPHHEPTGSHVEQTGSTHQFVVHDDATCAVCALRSLRALPSTAALVLPAAIPHYAVESHLTIRLVVGDRLAHRSRAPPFFG